MQYYILETAILPGANQKEGFQEALAGHLALAKGQFEQGIILFSALKPRNSGGIRIIKIADGEAIEPYWQVDPMVAAGMMEYRVTPFTPVSTTDDIKLWFA